MSHVLNIARWECFKLLRRKMPWILLALLFSFTQLAVWGSYTRYNSIVATGGRVFIPEGLDSAGRRAMTCTQLREGSAALPAPMFQALQQQCSQLSATLVRQYQALSPEGGASSTLVLMGSLGLILFGILAVAVVGSEYGVGTLRPILARGTGRLSFIAGKCLALIVIATVAVIALCALAALSGLLAALVAPPPPGGVPAVLAAGASVKLPLTFAKSWGGLVAVITMTSAITLLLRSTTAGMAFCLAWVAGEGIIIRLLSTVFTFFDAAAVYLPVRNIAALASVRTGSASPLTANDIGIAHASLVVTAYALALAVIAAVVFRRRDIAGAGGS